MQKLHSDTSAITGRRAVSDAGKAYGLVFGNVAINPLAEPLPNLAPPYVKLRGKISSRELEGASRLVHLGARPRGGSKKEGWRLRLRKIAHPLSSPRSSEASV